MIAPINYIPSPELRAYIINYGILDVPEGINEPYFSPPIGLSGFIFQTINTQNTIIAKIEDRDFFTQNAVVTGQVTTPVHGRIVGKTRTIMVFFQPLGMYHIFGTNMASLTNKAICIYEFLGKKKADELLKCLKENQTDESQIKVLNDFFSSMTPIQKDTHKMSQVLDYIQKNKGDVSVNDILDFSNFNRKTLERDFKKMVGLSPKVYTQIYRFKCLINLLQSDPTITWAQLANEAGYYDQSHMSRYIKEYLKVSPNSIVQLDMEYINYLLNR